jgi:hypothetical protein
MIDQVCGSLNRVGRLCALALGEHQPLVLRAADAVSAMHSNKSAMVVFGPTSQSTEAFDAERSAKRHAFQQNHWAGGGDKREVELGLSELCMRMRRDGSASSGQNTMHAHVCLDVDVPHARAPGCPFAESSRSCLRHGLWLRRMHLAPEHPGCPGEALHRVYV